MLNGDETPEAPARDMLYTRSTDAIAELVARVRGIDDRLGHSPDPALGQPGSGLCKVVSELKVDADYQTRVREEIEMRAAIRRARVQALSAALGGFIVLSAAAWAVFRFATLLVH